ncbi:MULTISPECIES: IS630 family transposase [Streptomyces]|uniref:IS630 family transposase n=1 Tax=Streptomyces TaxID=1883 RepID=UPI003B837A7B
MRYAQGGGLTPKKQAAREQLRLEAAERFARGEKTRDVARELRVGERQVEKWRRTWREGGAEALRSKGPMCVELLSPAQWERLVRELERGTLAHGWDEEQGWTLVRIRALIIRLFLVEYTVQGVWKLMRRHGWSPQVPARRALERDDASVERWRSEVGDGKATAAAQDAYICFEDEAGQGLRPPKGHTWAPRGRTPQVRVRGSNRGRVSVAGVVCYKSGERSRLFYRLHMYRGRKGEAKSFGWQDYRDLIVVAHNQLKAPVVWVWDNLNVHLVDELALFFMENEEWLTVFQLPSYAPELNPQEGIWSLVKRGLADFAAANLDHLSRIMKRKLKKIQYRPELIDGCLTETGLIMSAG